MRPVDLCKLFQLDDNEFKNMFRKTPLWRARRRLILRNAAIVLGNQKFRPALEVLNAALDDSEKIVREACRWAIDQIEGV